MSEQELRGKIVKILEEYKEWFIEEDYKRDIAKIDYKGIADVLIENGIGDVSELKKHRVQIMKDGTIQQLYSGEEVEQIVNERDEYKHRAEVAEDELARHKLALRIAGDKFINEVCNMRAEDISDKCDYKCDTCFYDYYLQQVEKELQEERKDE